MADLLFLIPLLPLAAFCINILLGRSFIRDQAHLVALPAVFISWVLSVLVFLEIRSDEHAISQRLFTWIPSGDFDVTVSLYADQLTAVMLLVVTTVGFLVHVYSVGYMHADGGYYRFFAYLPLFVFSMLMLVLADNLLVLFVFWEAVGLCSYLLIGYYFRRRSAANAARKAFIVNRIGDLGFGLGVMLAFWTFGTIDFWGEHGLFEMAAEYEALGIAGGTMTAIGILLFIGACGKSAQFPLHVWLPDAMEGPTPVSALIHAATMVTAGVYLVVRTNVLFAMAPLSSAVVAGVGALTAIFAATIALRQYDIKKVLAYSTVSQLGYMFLAVGSAAFAGGIFHLVTHAFFKALLFLGAGSVIHAMHHAYHATHSHEDAQDMRNMGGLRERMPVTFWLMAIATLAIAGIPPLSGFFSKDEILASAFARGAEMPIYYLYYALGLVAALLTAFYMARLMAMTFLGRNRTGAEEGRHLHEAPWIMTGPLVVLGVLSAVGGLINLPTFVGGHHELESWLEPVTAAGAAFARVELPHGTTEFLLVGGAVLVGVVGLVLGYRTTLGRTIPTAREAPADAGLARVLNRKYYVDEIYDAAIVRPVVWLSRVVLWKGVDQGLVDGAAVNGTAKLSRGLGWLGSRLQTGQVGLYVVLFLVGALWILRAMIR